MLDLLEALGIDCDSLDSGQSRWIHGKLRPHARPQSLCSAIIDMNLMPVAGLVGFWHCLRAWERYR